MAWLESAGDGMNHFGDGSALCTHEVVCHHSLQNASHRVGFHGQSVSEEVLRESLMNLEWQNSLF